MVHSAGGAPPLQSLPQPKSAKPLLASAARGRLQQEQRHRDPSTWTLPERSPRAAPGGCPSLAAIPGPGGRVGSAEPAWQGAPSPMPAGPSVSPRRRAPSTSSEPPGEAVARLRAEVSELRRAMAAERRAREDERGERAAAQHALMQELGSLARLLSHGLGDRLRDSAALALPPSPSPLSPQRMRAVAAHSSPAAALLARPHAAPPPSLSPAPAVPAAPTPAASQGGWQLAGTPSGFGSPAATPPAASHSPLDAQWAARGASRRSATAQMLLSPRPAAADPGAIAAQRPPLPPGAAAPQPGVWREAAAALSPDGPRPHAPPRPPLPPPGPPSPLRSPARRLDAQLGEGADTPPRAPQQLLPTSAPRPGSAPLSPAPSAGLGRQPARSLTSPPVPPAAQRSQSAQLPYACSPVRPPLPPSPQLAAAQCTPRRALDSPARPTGSPPGAAPWPSWGPPVESPSRPLSARGAAGGAGAGSVIEAIRQRAGLAAAAEAPLRRPLAQLPAPALPSPERRQPSPDPAVASAAAPGTSSPAPRRPAASPTPTPPRSSSAARTADGGGARAEGDAATPPRSASAPRPADGGGLSDPAAVVDLLLRRAASGTPPARGSADCPQLPPAEADRAPPPEGSPGGSAQAAVAGIEEPAAKAAVRPFPTQVQPSLVEERWVSRGTYAPFSAADVTRPGVPPPDRSVAGERFDVLLESGSLYKWERDGTLGFYNASPDREFTLSFCFGSDSAVAPAPDPAVTQTAGTYSVRLLPGETRPFVRGAVDGYRITMQYGRPDARWLARLREEADAEVAAASARAAGEGEGPFLDAAFPPAPGSLRSTELGDPRTTPRPWRRQRDALAGSGVSCGVFIAPPQPNTIRLGALGDAWLLSGLALLAERPALVRGMFPECSPAEAARGERKVALYPGGWRTEVTVDEWVPYGGYAPAFAAHLTHPGELWPGLVQKAIAKVRGSYVALRRGDPLSGLAELTGRPVEPVPFTAEGWGRLRGASPCGGPLVALWTAAGGDSAAGREQGLLPGAVYCALRAEEAGPFRLLQLRNPWLPPKLWQGDWAHASPLWDEHPYVCTAVGMTFDDDGTFWVSWEEAQRVFAGAALLHVDASARVSVRLPPSSGICEAVMLLHAREGGAEVWAGLRCEDAEGALTVFRDAGGGWIDTAEIPAGPAMRRAALRAGRHALVVRCNGEGTAVLAAAGATGPLSIVRGDPQVLERLRGEGPSALCGQPELGADPLQCLVQRWDGRECSVARAGEAVL
eukprot:TRINITY_DN2712_c0_g1_i2.p1 TRINITY_DN2712_c0_g1~~TRINITY_DN2712_c0_g1_i2.p1  ORF type:complete len:1258 (+),score=323.16 TRINITY_DN2712_c0_g1_i2:74-3847(+)